ncbi:MAG: hypothetical protein GX638_15145 [Crenarchaeota archaeon]|nr:hypothetical protein [Thermoproteota archaeon]
MPARKMRVELFDNEGNRYTVAFEGQVTRDKALRLLDLVELLGGMPGETPATEVVNNSTQKNSSRLDKVRSVIHKSFPLVWFSSKDLQAVYEQNLNESISLSTVSTYLSRLSNKGYLLRTGGSNNLKYKMTTTNPQSVIKQKLK